MDTPSSPDNVCAEFAEQPGKITIRKMDAEYVLIEGSAEALESLANLIKAQARFVDDCSFFISPTGPGSAVFSPASKLGIYIHRLPCKDGHVTEEEVDA